MKHRLKKAVLSLLSRLTGRHAVLLPAETSGKPEILPARAPYRSDEGKVTIRLQAAGRGQLDATLLGYLGHFPDQPLWRADALPYSGPCDLEFDPAGGRVFLDGQPLAGETATTRSRRFSWHLTLRLSDGRTLVRQTGHYLAIEDQPVDSSYYSGANYVDHESESAGEGDRVLRCLREHGAEGPVLEIGCATGGVLQALSNAGFEALGIDYSQYAIEQATQRLGPGRAFCCDAETEPLPEPVQAAGPFRTLLLWSVFEHFHQPFEALARLSEQAAPGALLAINTVNADSLCRRLYGRDWEGYFDWTHHGVDQVSAATLRDRLPELGWRIESLITEWAWGSSPDPLHATVREWFAYDARFRRLLIESEAGDFITLIARRESGSP